MDYTEWQNYLNNMEMTDGESRSLKVRGQGSGTKQP